MQLAVGARLLDTGVCCATGYTAYATGPDTGMVPARCVCPAACAALCSCWSCAYNCSAWGGYSVAGQILFLVRHVLGTPPALGTLWDGSGMPGQAMARGGSSSGALGRAAAGCHLLSSTKVVPRALAATDRRFRNRGLMRYALGVALHVNTQEIGCSCVAHGVRCQTSDGGRQPCCWCCCCRCWVTPAGMCLCSQATDLGHWVTLADCLALYLWQAVVFEGSAHAQANYGLQGGRSFLPHCHCG